LLIEFIGARDAVGRLDRFLCLEYVDGAGPYLELDDIYRRILWRANTWLNPSAKATRTAIATVVLLRDPLSIGDLAVFLSVSLDDIRNTLRDLHSVVIVPDDPQEPIRFFHRSFQDFLQDRHRCTDKKFLVNAPAHENFMASRSINLMRGADTAAAATAKIYANKYWFSHLLRARGPHDLRSERNAHKSLFPLFWEDDPDITNGDRDLVEGLIWLIGDEDTLAESYDAGARGSDGGNLEDIISFLQSLVKKHEAEFEEWNTLLSLLHKAEVNPRIASARDEFKLRRREFIWDWESSDIVEIDV